MNLCFTETIKDYPGYLITRDGRVLSIDRRDAEGKRIKGRVFKPNIFGYSRVQLCKGGKIKGFSVHRLVAIAFIPNPNNLPEVNHKNGIKSDNRVENLEWCTQAENKEHCYNVLGKKDVAGKLNSKKVKQIKDGEVIKIWESCSAAGRAGFAHVSCCCRGDRLTSKGFKWEFA